MGNQEEATLLDEITLGNVSPKVYSLPLFLPISKETPIVGCTFKDDVAL
jgi:hypothetical protein